MNSTGDDKSTIEQSNSDELTVNSDDDYIFPKEQKNTNKVESKDPETICKLRVPRKNFNIPSRVMPASAVPEKIIFCMDTCPDEKGITLQATQTAVELFMRLKHQINPLHEYALLVLGETKPRWVRNFTSDPRLIVKSFNGLQPSTPTNDTFDLTALFELIKTSIQIPPYSTNYTFSPPFIVRVVFIYSRSHCVPTFSKKLDLSDIYSPYFHLDVMWMHNEESNENNVHKIRCALNSICDDSLSYFLDIAHSASSLKNSMGKLLGHPLQRPLQNMVNYTFDVSLVQDETNN